MNVMSNELVEAFGLCIKRVQENRYEPDKIDCIIRDLQQKVLIEMSQSHNKDYAKCKELLRVINKAEEIQASTVVTLAVVRDKLEQHFA